MICCARLGSMKPANPLNQSQTPIVLYLCWSRSLLWL